MIAKTPAINTVPTTDGNQMWKVTLGNVRVYLTGNVEEAVHVPCLEYKEPEA